MLGYNKIMPNSPTKQNSNGTRASHNRDANTKPRRVSKSDNNNTKQSRSVGTSQVVTKSPRTSNGNNNSNTKSKTGLCDRPEKLSHLAFRPRCDILEYLFCKRREQLMEGGGVRPFKMCEYGTMQFTDTCYYNAFVNGILLNQALAYHAYAKMFEYIAGTFLPKLSKTTINKMSKLVDVIDPTRCSLDSNLDFFTMLHAFFCNYDGLIDQTRGINYHEYVIKNLYRQRSLQSRIEIDAIDNGNPSNLLEPVIGKKFGLKYEFVPVSVLESQSSQSNDNSQTKRPVDVVVVRGPERDRDVDDMYRKTILLEIIGTYRKANAQANNTELSGFPKNITGAKIFEDTEEILRSKAQASTRGLAKIQQRWKKEGVPKKKQVGTYDFVIDTIRKSIANRSEKGQYNTINRVLSKYGIDVLLEVSEDPDAFEDEEEESAILEADEQLFEAITELYDQHSADAPRDDGTFEPITLDTLPTKLPMYLEHKNRSYKLAYGCMSMGLLAKTEHGGHAIVGAICDGKPIVCDSNFETVMDVDWTDKKTLHASMKQHAKSYKMKLVSLNFDHVAYVREEFEAQAIDKIRELHNKFME